MAATLAADWMDTAKAGQEARIQLLTTVQHGFARLTAQGASGMGLRKIIVGLSPLAERLTANDKATADEKSNAWAMLYHLQRPELNVEARVPSWLLNQIKETVYGVLSANNRIMTDVELDPTFFTRLVDGAVFVAKESAANVPKLPSKVLDLVPTWVWVAGGALLVIGGLVLARRLLTPLPRLQGVEYGTKKRRRKS